MSIVLRKSRITDLGDARVARIPVGAPIKYLEEVFAYALGHGAAGRIHGIPFAPLEAFGSLEAGEIAVTLTTGTGLAGLGVGSYLLSRR